MKSLVKIVEQGATERIIATNTLTFAFEVLREPFTKKKTLSLKVGGQRKDSSRFMATIGSEVPDGAVRPWDKPKLEYKVEVLDDVTDDEAEPRKRGRDDEDDELDEGSHKLAKIEHDRGQEVEEDDDYEGMF